MATTTADSAFANRPGTEPVGSFAQVGRTNFSVSSKIKEMYASAKPTAVLAEWLGISQRTAERKLGGQRPYSAEELGHLLRSERGFEILAAVMADAKPAWWRICAPLMEVAEIRKMQKAAQRRVSKALEGALDADRDLTDAIARADALAVHDEDHMRPHLDALRTMARVSDRPVAPTRKGR